jgi:DNA-binding CsgD family transcriptional regulator
VRLGDLATALPAAGKSTLLGDAAARAAASGMRVLRTTGCEPEQLLREAAGNPLALTELPLTARHLHDTDPIVPLTDGLARAFTARVAGLPTATRTCLLIAALNDSDSMAETLTTASADVRTPLLRSAIVAAADPGERRDAHRALATTLHGQPDRRVWHVAAATDGPEEDVAAGLAAAADRAVRRGGVHAAIAAWERAARLSEAPDRKVERLLRAAELAVDAGRRDAVERLLREVATGPLSARQRATATWLVSALDDGIRDGSGAVALARLAQSVAEKDTDLATRILWGAGMCCFWIEPGPDARQALLAVADRLRATALALDAERIGLVAGARPVLATAQRARTLVALGEGRHGDAFADLRRTFDPADPTYQLALRCYVLPELADAALRCDRTDELRRLVAELEEFAPSTPSPALHIGLRYVRAVLAPGDHAEELFHAALSADLTGWPLDRGRVQLAFGEWLRRQRRAMEARAPLRAARDTFDALGVLPWSERARQELRTAGESSPQRGPDARDRLTPHELSIATLAVKGLTNREIGQRLYLSHRMVSTHVHRIFSKLGVSSRTELAAALRT